MEAVPRHVPIRVVSIGAIRDELQGDQEESFHSGLN
jgi:hypothetical protein